MHDYESASSRQRLVFVDSDVEQNRLCCSSIDDRSSHAADTAGSVVVVEEAVASCHDNMAGSSSPVLLDPAPWLGVCVSTLRISIPTAISFCGYFSVTIVGQLYASQFGVSVIGGYGLATMIVNSCAFAVVTGLSGGLDTLISQAYGKSPTHPLIGVFAQRGLLCFLCLTAPVGVLFYLSPHWLAALHFASSDVVNVTGNLLQLLVVVVPVWVLSEVLATTLTSINRTREVFIGSVGASVLHPLVLYLLLDVAGVGYQGLALGWAITIATMFCITCVAAVWTKSLYNAGYRGCAMVEALKGWVPLLRISLPAMCIMLCEWSAFEVNVMLSARYLPDEDFAAVVICQQLYCALSPIPVALGYAITVKVGNYVGAQRPATARRTAVAGALMMLVLCITGATVLALARGPLSSIFSSHQRVRQIAEETLPSAAVMYVFDVLLGAFTGVLRGVGEPTKAALCTAVGWWIVGIPTGLLLYNLHGDALGARCFFLGPACGLVLSCCLTSYAVFCHVQFVENETVAPHFAAFDAAAAAGAAAMNDALQAADDDECE